MYDLNTGDLLDILLKMLGILWILMLVILKKKFMACFFNYQTSVL